MMYQDGYARRSATVYSTMVCFMHLWEIMLLLRPLRFSVETDPIASL
jgi:hypothetical protein